MNHLERLIADKNGMEALHAYIVQFIAEEGVKKIFAKKDVSHVADAKELIDGAFEQLKIDYGTPATKETQPNPAR